MKFILITKDPQIEQAARAGFHPSDEIACYADWNEALNKCKGADMVFVDLLATLTEPNKIAGYETFAVAKMEHQTAKGVPLVLISPDDDYELDFMSGWPDFVFGHIKRPVNEKIFRRASSWV